MGHKTWAEKFEQADALTFVDLNNFVSAFKDTMLFKTTAEGNIHSDLENCLAQILGEFPTNAVAVSCSWFLFLIVFVFIPRIHLNSK